jgi:hypothetical protein
MMIIGTCETSIILGRVDNEIREQQTLKGCALASNDYESGLKILARIIARVHMKRIANKLGYKDEFPKNKV